MVFETIFDILIAFFALFGLYTAIRLVFVLFFAPKGIGVALFIGNEKDAGNVDILLLAAKENFYARGRGNLVVLVDRSLAENAVLLEKLQRKHAKIHVVDINEK